MHGRILDVTVKDYTVYRDQNLQEGYGFVTMASYEDALNVVSNVQNTCIDGIVLTCQLARHHSHSIERTRNISSSSVSNAEVGGLNPFIPYPPPASPPHSPPFYTTHYTPQLPPQSSQITPRYSQGDMNTNLMTHLPSSVSHQDPQYHKLQYFHR